MRSHTIVHWFAAAGAASLLLTACSHGDKGDAKSGAKRVTIGSIMGAPDSSNINYGTRQQQIEESVAKCMITAGWDYTVVKYPDMNLGAEPTTEDQVEKIKREGFGIAYKLLNEGAPTDDPWANFVDPNTEYVNTLDGSEQKAYDDSLYGVGQEDFALSTGLISSNGESHMVRDGRAGCRGAANTEVKGNDLTSSPEYWDAMQGYYDDLDVRRESDPRIVKLDENWSVCMKKQGFDYELPMDVWNGAEAEFEERANQVLGAYLPMEGWSQEKIDGFRASATQDDIAALYNNRPPLTADQRSQLDAILAEEVTLRLADYTCSQDRYEKLPDLYAQIEEAYALEHQDELEAMAVTLANKE